MTLRPATDADREVVRQWRNHPTVRAASLTQHEITADEHRRWWDRAMSDDSIQVLVYERAGTPCGVVTFSRIDPANRTAYWGYYLDNDGLERSEGTLHAWMEIQREAVRHADEALAVDVLDSEVIEANTGVLRFNRRNGFAETGTRMVEVGGRSVRVVSLRRHRPDISASQSAGSGTPAGTDNPEGVSR